MCCRARLIAFNPTALKLLGDACGVHVAGLHDAAQVMLELMLKLAVVVELPLLVLVPAAAVHEWRCPLLLAIVTHQPEGESVD